MATFNYFTFSATTTVEEIKTQYRANCLNLHPDRGGNETEFKAMAAEYETICSRFESVKAEQEAARQAEEERREAERREAERQAEEERRKAAARPLYEARCKKWAHLMTEIPTFNRPEGFARAYYYANGKRFENPNWEAERQQVKADERKQQNTRRANILAMCRAAFPGVKFSCSYNNGWGGGFIISWTDGPTEAELKAATDLDLFVSSWDTFDSMTDCAGFEHAIFTDFADKYNGRSGEITTERTSSDALRAKVAEAIKQHAPQFANASETEDLYFDKCDLIKKFSAHFNLSETNREALEHVNFGWCYRGRIDLRGLSRVFAEYVSTDPEPKAKKESAPAFVPAFGPAYKAIKAALNGYIFARGINKNARGYFMSFEAVDIFNLSELLDNGETVIICKAYTYDGKPSVFRMEAGAYSVQKNRREKFAKSGVNLCGLCDPRKAVSIESIDPATAAALAAEAADVERQRQAWEAKQAGKAESEPQSEAKASTDASQEADTTREAIDPATAAEHVREALKAETVAAEVFGDFVEITGNTYKLRRDFRALGANWDKARKAWNMTAETWATVTTESESEPQSEPQTAQSESEPQSEPQAAQSESEPQSEPQTAQSKSEPQSEPQAAQSEPRATTLNTEGVERLRRVFELREQIEAKRAELAALDSELLQALKDLENITGAASSKDAEPAKGATQEEPQSEPQATESESEPQSEPQATQSESEPQSEQQAEAFRAAALHIETLEDRNEHTAAVLYYAQTLAQWCKDDQQRHTLAELVAELHTIDATHRKRGHILPEEYNRRFEIYRHLCRLSLDWFGETMTANLFSYYTIKTAKDEAPAA